MTVFRLGDHGSAVLDVQQRLAALGAKPEILPGDTAAPSERARVANELGASLCVSVHLGGGVPEASGPTCSYFGSATTYSPAGRRLAELILEELEREFGRRDRVPAPAERATLRACSPARSLGRRDGSRRVARGAPTSTARLPRCVR